MLTKDKNYIKEKYSPVLEKFKHIDLDGFLEELQELRKEIDSKLGEEDLKHLFKIEKWGHILNTIGFLTAGLCPNLLSMITLSLGRSTRWLLMHHIGHGGYDKVPNVPKRYTSRHFAMRWRRFIDWPDWMTPESWNYEHNVLHHSNTGEISDPDLLERNSKIIREMNLPLSIKYLLVLFLGTNWKYTYYSPSNLYFYKNRLEKNKKEEGIEWNDIILDVFMESYIPYIIYQFVIFPALYMPLGPWSVFSAFCNTIVAEALANFHGFFVIAPNHTAEDIYRFDSKPVNRAERILRQIIGSVNYKTGNDLIDYAQFWLNYQIEHHIWPDLPMLKYQQYQPKVKALCEKYNIPYLEEDVLTRFKKMLDITVGKTSMKRI
jgi:fatty acid desaturase